MPPAKGGANGWAAQWAPSMRTSARERASVYQCSWSASSVQVGGSGLRSMQPIGPSRRVLRSGLESEHTVLGCEAGLSPFLQPRSL